MADLTDHLEAGALIVARLADSTLDIGFKAVMQAAELTTILENKQVTPAAYVLYGGDQLGASTGRGSAQPVNQLWQIIVAVKNMRNIKTAESAMQEAGPLVTKVLEALQGWKPSANHDNLVRALPGQPAGYSDGFLYLSIGFTTEIVTIGTD